MKKYIELPNGYLSYSQMSLWLSSPQRYKDQYFDRRDELKWSNPGQDFGKMFADALEKSEETGDLRTDAAMLLIPKYDIADVAINTELETPYGWLKLIAKPDSLNSKTQDFLEFKTGKVAWTQRKAQKHLQMIYYAVSIWLHTGVKNRTAKLVWIETEVVLTEDPFKVLVARTQPTGRIEVFPVSFSDQDYADCIASMSRVASEIELAYAGHTTNPELTTF